MIGAIRERGLVRMFVQDNRVGMSERQVETLFTEPPEIPPDGKRKGAGIALRMCMHGWWLFMVGTWADYHKRAGKGNYHNVQHSGLLAPGDVTATPLFLKKTHYPGPVRPQTSTRCFSYYLLLPTHLSNTINHEKSKT